MPEFSEMLRSDFSWPKPGDVAFKAAAHSQGARIDPHGHGRMVLMMTGYKEAADLLVERASEASYLRESLVYPIVFNYRQAIELNLKYLIATYGPAKGISPNWNSHDIALLWGEFQNIQDACGVEEHDQSNPAVKAIIAEFAKVDPRSFSFRYPVDTKGQLVPLGVEHLDLRCLKQVMDGVNAFFIGCDGYLDHLNMSGT